ncbi:hypothetical protein G8C92_06125 [Paenibacillus donghaensis]|uniref:hypothetical protein n=1 Tax=Paenibacillus donghaensis TaxID=414771 RepID=UPI00188405C7|nr:hypothetical protein [Paenibacillus donghaensis]MBE9913606.1 hypothetical protein [Paenibacillus donghaensis]
MNDVKRGKNAYLSVYDEAGLTIMLMHFPYIYEAKIFNVLFTLGGKRLQCYSKTARFTPNDHLKDAGDKSLNHILTLTNLSRNDRLVLPSGGAGRG